MDKKDASRCRLVGPSAPRKRVSRTAERPIGGPVNAHQTQLGPLVEADWSANRVSPKTLSRRR
jgi:hypothetical protein